MVVNFLVVQAVLDPRVQAVEKTVEIPQLQIVKKVVEIPEIQLRVSGTAPVRQVAPAEIAEVVKIGECLLTESASLFSSRHLSSELRQ